MNTRVLERRMKDILFRAELSNHVCLLGGHSGESKSFLFRKLQGAIEESWNRNYIYINHNNYNSILSRLHSDLEGYIIVFDDFELYPDNAINILISNKNTLFVVICKDCFEYFGEDTGEYEIIHQEDLVLCRKKT